MGRERLYALYRHPGRQALHALMLLRDMGWTRRAGGAARSGPVRDHITLYEGGQPFFEGEVEPCINGRLLNLGAYFGEPCEAVLERLLGEQLEDGGWNCEAPPSVRSSFHSTICVLEGLLEYERAKGAACGDGGPRPRRGLSPGAPHVSQAVVRRGDQPRLDPVLVPSRVSLRRAARLDYLRSTSVEPDDRVAEATLLVQKTRRSDGRWLSHRHADVLDFDMAERADSPAAGTRCVRFAC